MCSIWQMCRDENACSGADHDAVCQAVRTREIASAELLSVRAASAQDLDHSALSGDTEAFFRDVGNFADLSDDICVASERALARIKELHLLTVHSRPCTGRRVAAADQVVNEVHVISPVYAGFSFPAPAFVSRLALVLTVLPVFVSCHEIRRFEHGLYPERKELVEIDVAESLVRTNVT